MESVTMKECRDLSFGQQSSTNLKLEDLSLKIGNFFLNNAGNYSYQKKLKCLIRNVF